MSQHKQRLLEVDEYSEDICRYRKWLPTSSALFGKGRTITYQSERLCHVTGLPHLWIAFNGYWPEKGAMLETTTFKDLEARTVLARLPYKYDGVLVVPSAGNSAAAFAYACSQKNIPCLIVVPSSGLQRMQVYTISKALCESGIFNWFGRLL